MRSGLVLRHRQVRVEATQPDPGDGSCSLLSLPRNRLGIFPIQLERRAAPVAPDLPRVVALFSLEPFGHPQERAEDQGPVVAGDLDDARLFS